MNEQNKSRKEVKTMNWLDKVLEQIPEGESYVKGYRAFEGDIRIITENELGQQFRYTVKLVDGEYKLERM